MSNPAIRTGRFLGTGAAVNIQLGFIPDVVFMWNYTDGDMLDIWHRGRVMAFTSGGTYQIMPGDRIQGATNTGVRTTVREVHLTSGTWAGGDAAGYIVFDVLDQTGAFGSENVDLLDPSGGNSVLTANVAAVAVQAELGNWTIILATASLTPANGIQPYIGAAGSASHGFTVTATASESAKLFGWLAIRQGPEFS